jgi:hypothetical protein
MMANGYQKRQLHNRSPESLLGNPDDLVPTDLDPSVEEIFGFDDALP